MFSTASILAGIGVRAVASVASSIASAVGASGDSAETPSSAKISISSEAKAALQSASARDKTQQELRDAAQNNPQLAEQLARAMAYTPDRLSVRNDQNDWANSRYANGTPVTDGNYQSSMNGQISAAQQQRIALYENERAKGTPAAQIYDKLQAFNASLSNDYRVATGLA